MMLDKITNILSSLSSGLHNQAMLNNMSLAAIRIIKKRTREGRQIGGLPFKGGQGYSDGHEKKRREAGLPVDRINLEFNDYNGMLQHIDHIVFNDLSGAEVDIYDAQRRKIAYYLNTAGAGKNKIKFPFFGLSAEETKLIGGLVEDQLQITINKLSED